MTEFPDSGSRSNLGEWFAREAIPFSLQSEEILNCAVDRLMSALNSIELLGLGEALHGGEEILQLRNKMFERLVTQHGFTAISVESCFRKGRLVNDYVLGSGDSFDQVRELGFSHGFGALEANRELVEWMRRYNDDAAHPEKLHFYGFDSPTEMMWTETPRHLIERVIAFLESVDSEAALSYRERIRPLLRTDAEWENSEAMMDPSKSVGLSPEAHDLRIAVEDLHQELMLRGPEVSDQYLSYQEALQFAKLSKLLLNYHAVIADSSDRRIARCLAIRDLMMAEILEGQISTERTRGKVFAFAHNSHLGYGKAQWQLGPHNLVWWPAGAHLRTRLGTKFVVIGTGLGVSQDNGIGEPEKNTLEAVLTAASGPARFVPAPEPSILNNDILGVLSTRSGSTRNGTYFPLTGQSIAHFDWLAVLDCVTYTRGGPKVP